MLGALDGWFTSRLAGIQQQPDSIAYRDLRIAPALLGEMTSAKGSFTTPYGEVRTDWHLDGTCYRLAVTVPAGATAEVHVPSASSAVEVNGDAEFVRMQDGAAVYEVGSGEWTFNSTVAADGR
ncbi:alpha-L-rhamnosidase C-terminal domain-containing protein [Streptomyces pseudoechinosporeus]